MWYLTVTVPDYCLSFYFKFDTFRQNHLDYSAGNFKTRKALDVRVLFSGCMRKHHDFISLRRKAGM